MQTQPSLRQPVSPLPQTRLSQVQAPRPRVPQAPRLQAPRPLSSSLDLVGHMDIMGAPMSFSRNAEIYGENEPADYLYKVVSGTVRTYKIFDDGRRQIGGVYFPRGMFGLQHGDA